MIRKTDLRPSEDLLKQRPREEVNSFVTEFDSRDFSECNDVSLAHRVFKSIRTMDQINQLSNEGRIKQNKQGRLKLEIGRYLHET